MKNILLLGAFGFMNEKLDGQTIKTRDIYRLLKKNHDGKVFIFDTLKVKITKNPLYLFELLLLLIKVDVVIIAPASHSMATLYPVIYKLSSILRYDLIMTCVGGWQVEFFLGGHGYTAHPRELKISKKIRAFLPEMENVNKYLINNLGFTNTEVFPNFRFVAPFVTHSNEGKVFKVVFMARVDRMKGYDTIFEFAKLIEKENLNITIDFYGQLEPGDEDDFTIKVESNSTVCSYKGPLRPSEIYETLSSYDVLVLPTKYYTEGFPGSILDAYISGIPVIVTEWKHSHEFVSDGENGIIVPFDDCQEAFNNAVLSLYYDKKKLDYMKSKTSKEAIKYSPDSAWKVISKYLN